MKKRFLAILLVLALILSSTLIAFAAPYDLTYSADSTKNYTFFEFIDRPDVFDFVATHLADYQIEAEDGNKYNASEINDRTMSGMTFTQAVASLQATAAVVQAETSKLQADIDAAQALVTALPSGPDKTGLQVRLDALIASIPVTPPAPSITNDDTLNTVTGMQAGLEYDLDGAGYVAYDPETFNAINFAGNHSLLVRVAAAGINPPSAPVTLTFTMSVMEAAELAVSDYETAPIGNIDQITAAEALKAPADAAVAAVTDPTAKAAFEQRIATRAIAIANAKAAMQGTDTAAQAAAETAVAAFEATTFVNISQINTALGLKATADSKVAAVQNATAKSAFTTRINAKFETVAIAHVNLETYYGSMETIFTRYAAVLGIDLTEYNTLSNKQPVQTAMISPTFATSAEIKTAFDNAVAAQKLVEAGSVSAFNSATDGTQLAAAIGTYATQLQLTLTEYNAIANKTALYSEMLAKKPYSTGEQIKLAFIIAVLNNTSTAGVKTVLSTNAGFLGLGQNEYTMLSTKSVIETAVTGARPIADKTQILILAYNSTILSGYIGQMLQINGTYLGLDLTAYNALLPVNQLAIQAALVNATINSAADLKTAFDTAVAAQTSSQTNAVIAFNNAADEAAVAAAITTYITGTSLSNYNALAYKLPVQTAMLTPVFYTMADLILVFDAAVSAQKTAETNSVNAISNAADLTTMAVAINVNALNLGLELTDYNTLSPVDQAVVHQTMIADTFYTASVLKTTFDNAVATQKAVNALNTASAATMGVTLTTNATLLGLTLTDYNSLIPASRDIVNTALVGKAFPDKTAVKTALNTAVSVPLINQITTTNAMATAISNYASVLDLTLTDYNALTTANRTTVQTALIGKSFADKTAVKTAFDAAVSIAKEVQAIAAVNSATIATIHSVLTSNAVALGLDLTGYNVLRNKVPVQTAMVGKAFADKTALKTAFDNAVATEAALETPIYGTTGVTLNKANTYVLVGGTDTLIATVLPESISNKDVTWSSSNPARVTVDSNGVVTGISLGVAATVTVTTVDGSFTASCSVGVTTESNAIYQITQLSLPLTAVHIPLYAAALGLDLTAYNALPQDGQSAVQQAIYKKTFANATAFRTAFNDAVVAATPVPTAPDAPDWLSIDDDLNIVYGMDIGLDYNLDGTGWVAYDSATFDAIDLSGDHTLLVRIADDGFNPAGADITLTFTTNPPTPVTPDPPTVNNNDTDNTVSGMEAGMEYDLDGIGYVAYDADTFAAIDFSGDHTLDVRVASDGFNPPSDPVTLIFSTNL